MSTCWPLELRSEPIFTPIIGTNVSTPINKLTIIGTNLYSNYWHQIYSNYWYPGQHCSLSTLSSIIPFLSSSYSSRIKSHIKDKFFILITFFRMAMCYSSALTILWKCFQFRSFSILDACLNFFAFFPFSLNGNLSGPCLDFCQFYHHLSIVLQVFTGPRYSWSDLWVQVSLTYRGFVDSTDVTLADEDNNLIPTYNANRAIIGKWQCKWRHLVAKI